MPVSLASTTSGVDGAVRGEVDLCCGSHDVSVLSRWWKVNVNASLFVISGLDYTCMVIGQEERIS